MIYFLSSLPRSGSTLLASLLNQRPDTFASTTSNLCDVMGGAVKEWELNLATISSGGNREEIIRILRGMVNNRYVNHDINFDKSRTWPDPQIMKTMLEVQGKIKIVATVRPIVQCLASFVRIAKPDDVQDFCKNSQLVKHLFDTYSTLKSGYKFRPESFLFIEYDDLVFHYQEQMDRISEFIGAINYDHDAENVPPSGEVDEVWGIEGLHDVRSTIERRIYSEREVLGDELFNYYQGGEFWNDTSDPVRPVDLLDTQLEASLRGDFKTSEKLIKTLQKQRPYCNRVAFNSGWFELKKGNLQRGHELLDKGREESLFGNRFESCMPQWTAEKTPVSEQTIDNEDGRTNSTVLLNLEGGLGDQIHNFRYAQDISKIVRQVIISCSGELAPIFAEQFPTVQREAALGVYHDHWVASMSAIRSLGYEYSDIKGIPYIQRTATAIPGRIGVRWSGNPKFEHEQHRIFPAELMFDAVRNFNCVSLQHNESSENRPQWMPQADVSDWIATRKSISQCELVITSCTSVAHLAAAMGIETWIVVPILSYYLWALPGDKTPYYDSVTLFRQEKYDDWSAPFKNIKEKLKCMHTLKMAA